MLQRGTAFFKQQNMVQHRTERATAPRQSRKGKTPRSTSRVPPGGRVRDVDRHAPRHERKNGGEQRLWPIATARRLRPGLARQDNTRKPFLGRRCQMARAAPYIQNYTKDDSRPGFLSPRALLDPFGGGADAFGRRVVTGFTCARSTKPRRAPEPSFQYELSARRDEWTHWVGLACARDR